MPCAVLSVEKTEDGRCGEIRIVRSNQAYKEAMGPAYYDNMIYSELVPKDIKFEDFCFRAAHEGRRMHAYVEVKALQCWIDQTLVPMAPESDRLGYCQFLFSQTKKADPRYMANVSMDTAGVVIKACITLLGSEDFKKAVESVLDDIIGYSGAVASRIILIDHEKRQADCFCGRFKHDEYLDPELNPSTSHFSYELVDSWEETVGVSNAVILRGEHDLPQLEARNPMWVASLRKYGVKSLVLIPLRREGKAIGYLYVSNFDVEKTVEVKELLELVSFFLASEISNFQLLRQLEEMSTADGLTGIHNRNAMIREMRKLAETPGGIPFGVVSADLNGLKAINDSKGHDAGDELIQQAAAVLQEVFRRDDLYRIGGDEFLVLAEGISRELFDERLARLHAVERGNPDVSLSMGSFWSDGSVGVDEAYQHADENMYAAKQAFYTENPELQRR